MDKDSLTLLGRSDIAASAIRMRAARLAAGLSQQALADAMGQRISSISNIERAKNFPGWPTMVFLYKEHRVDVNFLVTGNYAQLPADVQASLLSQLVQIHATTDLLEDSAPRQTALRLLET